MMNGMTVELPRGTPCSNLILSDRLIALAEDADRAGYKDTAEMLVNLACSVFDEAPKKPH